MPHKKAPDLGSGNQTRGTPYNGKAFSRSRWRAANVNIAFRLQRFQLGRKKRGVRAGAAGVIRTGLI